MNTTIKPEFRTVGALLKNQSFAIDEYQREYKWEPKHITELLDDLLGAFESSYREGDTPQAVPGYTDYFLGSIIVTERSGKHYLVDGQQRVTSLTLLLIYLYRAAQEKGLSVASSVEPLLYSDHFGTPRFNLDIPERLPVIQALFRGEAFDPEGQEESIATMHERYQDIVERDLAGELEEALPHFIYWLMAKVGLIVILATNDNQAYAIFETMNDRGKPLSPVDMLKAYLLAPIEDAETRRRVNDAWKREVYSLITWGGSHEAERDATAIKAWFRGQYADTIRERKTGSTDKDWEQIGTTFHRWARDHADTLGIGTEEQNAAFVTRRFAFFCHAYQRVLEASRHYTPGLEAVYYNAHNEFTWQPTVLMAALDVADDADTVRRKLAMTATYLDIWIMRRVVNYIRVGYSSTSYAMFSLCRVIRRKPLDELAAILRERLDEDDADFTGSPSRGREGIPDLMLNQFTRRYLYHLLARLTAAVEVGAGRPDPFESYAKRSGKNAVDIEHIWPDDYEPFREFFRSEQDFQARRNHVSGLLLLPADVNRSFQAKPYRSKAPHYAKQNLYAASLTASAYEHQPQFEAFRARLGLPLKPYESYGLAEQQERTDAILALCQYVWSPDRLDASLA